MTLESLPFEQMVRLFPDGLVLLDQAGLIRYMNTSAEKLTGSTLSEAQGRHWKDVFSVRVDDPVGDQTGSLIEILHERPVLVTQSGRKVPIELQISGLSDEQGRSAGSMLILHDVTTLDLEKEGLKESRAKYKRLVNTIEGIVWEAEGEEMRIRFVSAYAEKILGYPPKNWIKDAGFWKNIIHPEDRALVLDIVSQSIRHKEDYQIEYRVVAADGRVLLVRDSVTLSVDEGQVRLSGVITDITDSKQARDALIKSEERFAAAFYANPVPLFLAAESGRILDANDSFERLTGYFRQQLVEQSIVEAGFCGADQFQTLIRSLAERAEVEFPGFLIRNRSGETRALAASFRHITLSGEPCLLGAFRLPETPDR